jgi:hypothetical protein
MIIKPFGFFRLKRVYIPCFYDPMLISWVMQGFPGKPALQRPDDTRNLQNNSGDPASYFTMEASSPITGGG